MATYTKRCLPTNYSCLYFNATNAENLLTDTSGYATLLHSVSQHGTIKGYAALVQYNFDSIPNIATVDFSESYIDIRILPAISASIDIATGDGTVILGGGNFVIGGTSSSDSIPSGVTVTTSGSLRVAKIPLSLLSVYSSVSSLKNTNFTVKATFNHESSGDTTNYFLCGVVSVTYTLPDLKVYTTLKGAGSTNHDFKTEIEYGTEDELLIYPPDEESLHTVTVLKDGVDVSASIIPQQGDDAYMEYTFNEIYDPNSEMANLNNSDWFNSIVGVRHDTTNLTDNNYYSNANNADVTFYYRRSEASALTMNTGDYIYLKASGHAENYLASNGHMSVQLILSPYYDLNLDGSHSSTDRNIYSEVYDFAASGAFNRVQEIQIDSTDFTPGVYYMAVKVVVGYYGGALNGLTFGFRSRYFNPAWSQHGIRYPGRYYYKFTVEADTKFEVFIDETPSGSRNRVNTTVVQGNLLGAVDPTQFDLYQGSSYKLYLALNNPTYKFWVRKRVNGGAVVDVTNQLVTVRAPEKHTARFDLGTFSVASGTLSSAANTWFSSRVGKGYDTTDATASNYGASSSGGTAYILYAFDDSQLLQMPDEFVVKNAYILINGHAQAKHAWYTSYMTVDTRYASAYVYKSINYQDYGTTTTTVRATIWPTPTIQDLKTGKLNLRCKLGYRGGAINGATLFIEYEDPRPAYLLRTGEYTYEETNEGNTQLDIYMLEMEKLWVKQNGVWKQATSSTYHHDPSDIAVMNTGVYVKDSNWVDHEQEHIYPVFFNKSVKKETT